MAASWIDEVKRTTNVAQVAGWVGMQQRLRSLGPCPACGAERRSRSDSRAPVGVTGDMRGWQCHACEIKGDAVELACYAVLGHTGAQADAEGWARVREWFAARGVDTSSAGSPGKGERRAPIRSVGAMVQGILGATNLPSPSTGASSPRSARQGSQDKRDQPRAGVGPGQGDPAPRKGTGGGLYRWEDGLTERCERALWADTPDAALARSYLMDVRKLSEDALRAYRLGLYVDCNGKPHKPDGRPIVVIPLLDHTEEPVSAKFRSVPDPGTCECRRPEGCPKCKSYRNCKDRPLPLYGSHLLSNDLDMPLIMVEGELEVLAAYTYGLRVNVVSTTAGAKTFREEWLDEIEPYAFVIGAYDADEAGDEGFAAVAEKLGTYRCARARLPRKDLGQCLMEEIPRDRIERVIERAEPMHGIAMRQADEYADQLETLINDPGKLRGVSTGLAKLDEVLGGWRPGVIVITGETGQGKAQPVDEPVITPTGWREIGSLRVGDEVVSVDGLPTRVVGVFPQGCRDIFEVEFQDGTIIRCDRDHLWAVLTDTDVFRGKDPRIMTAEQIVSRGLKETDGRLRWRVPTPRPIQHPEAQLPIPPYLMGVLLGDGCLTNSGVRLSLDIRDRWIADRIEACLPVGLYVKRSDRGRGAMDCRVRARRRGDPNPVSEHLERLGLRVMSCDRFIPDAYLLASVEQRVDLLQGLLDTDGTVIQGRVQFNTSSPRLAHDISCLVWSLGGSVKTSSKIPTYTHNREKREGRRAYTVNITLPPDLHRRAFSLPRKASLVHPRIVGPYRKIADIRPAGKAECVCIAVEHPSKLYVTRNYVVTHNTTFATWACLELARQGAGVLVTSFEQEPIGTVQKLLRNQIGGDFTRVKPETRRAALADLASLPLWILDHYGHLTPAKMVETMQYAKRRHGVTFFLVDHLGFLIDPDAPDERRAIEAIVRAFAIVAKQMGITIFLIAHPHNTGRDHRGKPLEITSRDLKGASAIRQDADDILIVSQIPPTKEVPWPRTRILADKVRSDFGVSGGVAVLAFDPGSTVYADTWDETPAGADKLLVPRQAANTHRPKADPAKT